MECVSSLDVVHFTAELAPIAKVRCVFRFRCKCKCKNECKCPDVGSQCVSSCFLLPMADERAA